MTPATLGEQTILAPRDYLTRDSYASADTSRGEILSMQCRACHTLESGAATIVGPNLYQIFGRTAGSMPDYPYSEALMSSGFVWTPRALDAWLRRAVRISAGESNEFSGIA